MFGAKEKCFLSRENEKNESKIVPQLYIENASRWIKDSIEDLSTTKSRQK